jgi:hypothetical protein
MHLPATNTQPLDSAGHVTRFLVGRDEPCPSCSYNLRNLTTDSCPECGLRLQLKVSMSDANMGAFIAGVIGLSMGAGFFLVLSGYLIWMIFAASFLVRTSLQDSLPVFVMLMVQVMALIWWLRHRRTVRRWPWRMRWGIACATFLFSGACVGIFAALNQ